MFLRLCVRAPRMLMRWPRAWCRYLPSLLVFKVGARQGKPDMIGRRCRPCTRPGGGMSQNAGFAGLLPASAPHVSVTDSAPSPSSRMTPLERRSSFSLAMIYAARMLGFLLVLPVFALEAARYPGGDNPALVGLGMGIYGLTQALLQIVYGLASDRLGRKRVIVAGLLVFAAGSFMAAAAPTL